jgi:hypothetical protein
MVKARLLWIFRNFSILDFSVLSNPQRRFIARVWYTGTSTVPADTSPDAAPAQLIGTIEGFPKKLYQPPVAAIESARKQTGFRLAASMRNPMVRVAMGVLLLGCAISLGPRLRWMPQPSLANVSANNVPATNVGATEVSPGVAHANVAAVQVVPVSAAPEAVAQTNIAPVTAAPSVTAVPKEVPPAHAGFINAVQLNVARGLAVASHGSVSSTAPVQSAKSVVAAAHVLVAKASAVPAFAPRPAKLGAANLPDAMANNAMANNEALPTAARPSAPVAALPLSADTKTQGHSREHPMVMVRVTVDSHGQALGFQLLRGNKKKISAAMAAAKRWPYQPCSGSSECAHLMRFTYFGNASVVTMVE